MTKIETTMKTNISIPVRIMPHHLTLSPALIAKVQNEIGSLARLAGDAARADVVLRLHHGKSDGRLFSASALLSLPGGDIHASATRANLYKAISALERLLARQLRKRKTRFEKRMETRRVMPGRRSAARLEEAILAA